MPTTIDGPWSLEEIAGFLRASTFPLRLACTGKDGYPRVISLWYRYHQGALQCVSHQNSALVRLLRRDHRVGFEVSPNEPPYHGVRGQGDVGLQPLGNSDVLEALISRYLGGKESRVGRWLLSRKDEEVLLTIRPERWFTWDYRERMADVSANT
ncbi:MAG: hypothetical protein RQ826_16580 [Xanthomonadales bacterium]|nr:hypothetical protein [Xanthomonadales bacterium]